MLRLHETSEERDVGFYGLSDRPSPLMEFMKSVLERGETFEIYDPLAERIRELRSELARRERPR